MIMGGADDSSEGSRWVRGEGQRSGWSENVTNATTTKPKQRGLAPWKACQRGRGVQQKAALEERVRGVLTRGLAM